MVGAQQRAPALNARGLSGFPRKTKVPALRPGPGVVGGTSGSEVEADADAIGTADRVVERRIHVEAGIGLRRRRRVHVEQVVDLEIALQPARHLVGAADVHIESARHEVAVDRGVIGR
ncbi:PH domain-containing protein [Sphingomonas pituitosa]|uniref:PH domain-containing protein n=1 Tax=Sphingomonas pituitosa TaxID=99597 RepID=UPI003570F4ED